jgi:hypothetical protein
VSPDRTCAVCGRSILPGERTRTLVSPKEGPQQVCELCRKRAEAHGWVDPVGPGANVGRRPDPPAPATPGKSRLEVAVDRFNASEPARTVAGLMRTLGPPWVSVGAAAGSPSEIRITVAWELSWYQWGVDVGDEARAVFQIDKGNELTQLDGSARQWNARTEQDGRLALGAHGPRAAAGGGG